MASIYEHKTAFLLYFICRDHLGSITHITDAEGYVMEENSYDAWGRRRNPANYNEVYSAENQPTLLLGRGYTGHEHLPWFGLVNMNARLYDPAVGRFLSPDPYVPDGTFSQDFNRYSYALNNPMCYVDEDGEWFFSALLSAIFPGVGTAIGIIIDAACWGATIGGGVYTASAALSQGGLSQNWNSNDFWRSVGVGAVSGAVTGGMGLIAPTFNVTSTSFVSNLPTYLGKAGYAGLTATAATGAGMMTNDFIQYGRLETSFEDYLKGMGIAGLTAGVMSFGKSMYDYATWDKLSATDKMTKVQNKFGANVQYDASATDYGYYISGSTDVYLGPAALESKRMAYLTARHELKHLSDWNKYTAGNLKIPTRRDLVDHLEIRAYKLEMRNIGITSKDYINNINFIRNNHGYRGFGTFTNPLMYFNFIF